MMLNIERRARELLSNRDVKEAMRIRCGEDGHNWEGACSVLFQTYKICKWCGEAAY